MKKIIRCSTIPDTLDIFCRGLLRELSDTYEVVAVSSPGPVLDLIGKREGVRTIGVKMSRRWDLAGDIKALFELVAVFRRERPDMVHSMTPKAGLLCMIASFLARVPVRLHTFTGLVFPTSKGVKRQVLKLTDRVTCACATHINPEGYGVMNDLQSSTITRKPLTIIGNGNVRGIDLDFFKNTDEIKSRGEAIRERLGIKDDSVVFIFVGRIVADKGINELISAFERLVRHNPDACLILVGEFENELDPVNDNVKDLMNTVDNLFLAGFQDDVRPWFAAADVLVFPSYREGFPNVVIEAGAMELPAIVTNINGSREIIKDGVNGMIIPAHDTDALYGTLSGMLENPDLILRLASKSREMIASRFEINFVRTCLKQYYRQLLS